MIKTPHTRFLPLNIAELKPYIPGKTIAEVQEAYHPEQISKLASNENRLGCSSSVKEAIREAMKEIQDYPDPLARRLRQALAEKNGVLAENIIVAAGSESIIAILCRTFFLDNDEAITADATFVGFFVQANIQDILLKKIPLTQDYRYDIRAIAASITGSTKMIYIANPNNPTGTYITKDEFEELMKQIPEEVLVIMDEAYYEYAEDIPDYPRAMDYEYKNVITLRTFSKAYGLAGARVGYAIASQKFIEPMLNTKLTFEPTILAQAAALAALRDKKFLAKSKYMVEKGRERLYHLFDEYDIKYIRSVSNSVMMICDTVEQAKNFTLSMLKKGIILRRTDAFGLPNGVRITIGTKKEMDHFEQSFKMVR